MPVPFPGYALRAGLVRRLEAGLDVQYPGAVGLDLKGELLRSRFFDIALRPSVYLNILVLDAFSQDSDDVDVGTGPGAAVALPILMDINLTHATSLVPHARAGWATGYWRTFDGDRTTEFLGGGLGFNWRVGENVALHPDVSALVLPDRSGAGWSPTWVTIAVAVIIGSQPEF